MAKKHLEIFKLKIRLPQGEHWYHCSCRSTTIDFFNRVYNNMSSLILSSFHCVSTLIFRNIYLSIFSPFGELLILRNNLMWLKLSPHPAACSSKAEVYSYLYATPCMQCMHGLHTYSRSFGVGLHSKSSDILSESPVHLREESDSDCSHVIRRL